MVAAAVPYVDMIAATIPKMNIANAGIHVRNAKANIDAIFAIATADAEAQWLATSLYNKLKVIENEVSKLVVKQDRCDVVRAEALQICASFAAHIKTLAPTKRGRHLRF